jgi:hypothetical protein
MYLLNDLLPQATFKAKAIATKRDPAKWSAIVSRVKNDSTGGVPAGKWNAVKASIAARKYKESGGAYVGKKSSGNGLRTWFRKYPSILAKRKRDKQ